MTRTAARVFAPLTVGGVCAASRSRRRALRAGADKVSVNLAAVELLRSSTGSRIAGAQAPVAAIDVKRQPYTSPQEWEVYVAGADAAHRIEGVAWAREVGAGAGGRAALTSMDRDGTWKGLRPRALERVRGGDHPGDRLGGVSVSSTSPRGQWIADAALAASIFHDGEHTAGSQGLPARERGIEVRP